MSDIYLSIGGNLGDRLKNISLCQKAIEAQIGHIVTFSPVYETDPWGFEHERSFYNQVLLVQSNLLPEQVMQKCLKIEQSLGRKRHNTMEYAGRIMDIDIVFYDDQIIEGSDLIVPHPRFKDRLFVLVPLTDIAPDFIDPQSGKSIETLKENCQDKSGLRKTNHPGKQLHHETR